MGKEPKRNVYVGHRYVPKIMGEWNKEQSYEGLSIVTHQGTSYTSKKHVPVGIDITNEEYWAVTGNYNAQVETYRQETKRVANDLELTKQDVANLNTNLEQTNESLSGVITDLTETKQDVANLNTNLGQTNESLSAVITDLTETKQTLSQVPEQINQAVLPKADKTEVEALKKYDPSTVTHYYVNGSTGSDNNDGLTKETAWKTIKRAIDYLLSLSEPVIDSPVEIHLSGTFSGGTRIFNLPRFRFPLKITGDVDVNGYPTTIIDGSETTGNAPIGLHFEYCNDLRVEIRNIKFTNFKNNFNGYGILMKKLGNIQIYNCIAEECDIGFAGIGNVYFYMEDCKAINCSKSGFRAEYSASGNFTRCEADGCVHGIYVSRNAVAHVDYCQIKNNSYAGVLVDMNSRVHVLGTIFSGNSYGLRAEGGAEWINNRDIPNAFTNNYVNYGHFGNSRETRLHSLQGGNEFRIGVTRASVVHTGTTETTTIYSGSDLGIVPANFFADKHKRLRFLITGKIEGAGSKTIFARSTDVNGLDPAIWGGITTSIEGDFILEVTVYANSLSEVYSTAKLQSHLNPNSVLNGTRTVDLTKERRIRLSCQLSDPNAVVTFNSFEVFLMG